jgi:NAD(P)H-hydrate repair Nnr-like enzyme with NAD(P)H-hydrate dehydratase domain
VGSWTNGRAGDLAYRDRGLHFIPEDVIGLIPEALQEFDRVE